jgi:glutamyl-tRNA synthetase
MALPKAEVDRRLAAGEPAVIRLKCPPQAITIKDEILGEATLPPGEVDDFVLRKADGFPTYHFAVVVDDELMGVTHVLRAQEHFNNTAKHMLLQDALGYRRPAYGHFSIITNPDGSKMSKRDKDKLLRKTVTERKLAAPPAGTVPQARWDAWLGDKNAQLEFEEANALAEAMGIQLPEINVDDFRRSGYLPEVLCNFLSLNGWSPGGDVEKFDMAFMKERFDLKRVVKTPAKFDRAKLLSFNCDAITGMPREEFLRRSRAHGLEFHPQFMARLTDAQFELLAGASHERSKTLDELFRVNRFLVTADDALAWERTKNVEKVMGGAEPNGVTHVRALVPVLEAVADWQPAALEAAIGAYAATATEGNLGKVAQPLRVAVSGGTVSPPIFDTLAILGKAGTLTRMRRCLQAFGA